MASFFYLFSQRDPLEKKVPLLYPPVAIEQRLGQNT